MAADSSTLVTVAVLSVVNALVTLVTAIVVLVAAINFGRRA